MSKLQELDNKYVANTYARFPVEIVSGKGSIAKDTDGKEYIDMGSGIGVTSFGIADDIWKQAVIDQLGKVQHMSNLYYTEPCVKLAELLCEKTGMKKVFFSNSGGEANECAIKVARKYAAEKKGPEYYTILTLWNSFHGRTLTTLAATGQDHYHELFQPLTPGFVHATANDLVSVQKLVEAHKVAGILIECIQGEGGVNPLTAEFIQGVDAICHEKDIVFMVDEVQTGNGRTGKLYSYMNFGVNPDVVTTAKGIEPGRGDNGQRHRRRPAPGRLPDGRKSGTRAGTRGPRLYVRGQPGGLRGGGEHYQPAGRCVFSGSTAERKNPFQRAGRSPRYRNGNRPGHDVRCETGKACRGCGEKMY